MNNKEKWAVEDTATAMKMSAEGYKAHVIADKLGRTKSQVWAHIRYVKKTEALKRLAKLEAKLSKAAH